MDAVVIMHIKTGEKKKINGKNGAEYLNATFGRAVEFAVFCCCGSWPAGNEGSLELKLN